MLSCESYAMILRLKRMDPKVEQGPLITFVGVRLSDKTALELHRMYATKHILLSPSDLAATNSAMASVFVFTNHSFQQEATLKDLWRVAREGAVVFILDGMKTGGIVESTNITDYKDYGLEFLVGGLMSCWPYRQGRIRKDLAKHFRS